MSGATIFEEHSQVLAHWHAQGAHGATLIYLDAHLDLQFIEPARIARLAACADAAQLARLESPHCLSPARDACYGIEDFLYPALQLGLVRRVVWVAPPHVIRGGMAAAMRGLMQMEGVTPEDLESFEPLAGGGIRGRLLGADLTICLLGHLPSLQLEGPLLVDIDADYFVVVPADTVWAEPAEVVAALRAVAGDEAQVTIARSVSSGFMPLQYRFIADQLAALWENRADDAAHWQRLLDSTRAPSVAALQALADARPQCAATAYALALASGEAALLARAAALDTAYGADLLRQLGEFRARHLALALSQVLRLQREVDAAGLDEARAAVAWISLGRLFTAFGELENASACDERSRGNGAGHPELALEIAKLHMARGQFRQAAPYLARAAADDETRVGAWVHQAECAHALGEHAAAGRAAEAARRAAPAWPMVLQRMAAYAAARGDSAQAAVLRAQQGRLDARLARVAARL
jgi:hypothetical protein